MEDIFKESLAVSVDESIRANFLDSLSIKPNASMPVLKYIFFPNRLFAFVFTEVCAVCYCYLWLTKCLSDLTTTLMILLTFFN